jgi:outer membrane protein TolC
VAAVALACLAAPAAAQQAPAPAAALTLPEVVRSVISRSRDIRQARYALDEAEERVAEAWGGVFPNVNVSASYIRNVSVPVNFLPAVFIDPTAGPDDLIPMKFGADNIWSSALNVDQPLFDARSFIAVGAAGRYRALQGELLRSRTQAVVTRVRSRYYELLLAQEQARLTENSVRRVREGLEQARALNRAGLTSEYDVLRLEVEVANLEPNLRRAVNAIAQARRQLAVELDLENPDSLRVAGSLATMELDDLAANSAENRAILEFGTVPAQAPSVDELVTAAMSARSDVRQLEFTETLRHTELRLEQVDYFPTVSVFGSYTINAQQNGSPDFFGRPRAYGRTVGVRVSLPLFNGFERESRIDQKRAAVRAAESQTRLATDQAKADVRTLAEQADESLARARGQRLAVKQAARGFEIVSAQHREGLSSQLELTDAEVALRQSEFNYAQAVYDWLATRARLDEAIGQVPMVDGEGTFE